jgi:hypothetical protein
MTFLNHFASVPLSFLSFGLSFDALLHAIIGSYDFGYRRAKTELHPAKILGHPTLNLQNFTYLKGLTASRQILRSELGQVGPAR